MRSRFGDALAFFSSLCRPCPRTFNPADWFVECLAVAPGKEATCQKSIRKICESFSDSSFRAVLKERIEVAALVEKILPGSRKFRKTERKYGAS